MKTQKKLNAHLHQSKKPIILVTINKLILQNRKWNFWDFYNLAGWNWFQFQLRKSSGLGWLLDEVVEKFPKTSTSLWWKQFGNEDEIKSALIIVLTLAQISSFGWFSVGEERSFQVMLSVGTTWADATMGTCRHWEKVRGNLLIRGMPKQQYRRAMRKWYTCSGITWRQTPLDKSF